MIESEQGLEMYHLFQPIYDVQKWHLVGYEGLLRTMQRINPEESFRIAKKEKRLYELDSRSIHKAFATYQLADDSKGRKKLFLNVFPSTIINPNFLPFIRSIIQENRFMSQQIILEIVESEQINLEKVKMALPELKKLGLKIAVDDFGKGSTSIRMLLELQPDFLKLDRYFVTDLFSNEQKKDVIFSLLNFCEKYNSDLIVEGVEDEISLAILKSLGVKYAQGYLLGKPSLLSRTGVCL
ncbi:MULTISPECIES: EAL domain-containing protein [Mesobacillus]|uniref:EAL domain-containing protein n=2 Tax=Mesobacillus TaxID=2675231 RepID=A0A0D6ZD77_9BACI|nr:MULTISPECIES: EAL domain-containing protein [Mesobacillus]KIY23749.1 hypothetical protein UB32_01150 [Mesobacillus subterraneus]MDQ0413388.1 EAL domain-containing protein (putative c-di-GMP-specific phosphodiesterase class I) [Mesobacillus stamsii]